MTRNPVEENFVTRFVLGMVVLFAMMLGGGIVGNVGSIIGIPYGGWLGVTIGALAVFVGFTALYRRYDESYDAE